ncbi:MAG: hypothetical protein RR350_04710, partial [Oscillibacter sp.]
MTIQEMIASQQAIVSGARAAGLPLTAEQQREFEQLQGQIDAARSAGNFPADPPANPPSDDGTRGAGNQPADHPTNPPAGGTDDAARQAVQAERQRNNDIMSLCRQTGMDPTEHIRNGDTMDTVRTAAVTYMLQHGAPISSRMTDNPGGDNFRQAAVDALLMRTGVNVEHPTEGAEEMRGMSLRDLAIECMSRTGEGSAASMLRMSKDD